MEELVIYRIYFVENKLNESLEEYNSLKFGDIVRFKNVKPYHRCTGELSKVNPKHNVFRYVVIKVVKNNSVDIIDEAKNNSLISAMMYNSHNDKAEIEYDEKNDLYIDAYSTKTTTKDTLIELDYVYPPNKLPYIKFLEKIDELNADDIEKLKKALRERNIDFSESLKTFNIRPMKENQTYHSKDKRMHINILKDKKDIVFGTIKFRGSLLYFSYGFNTNNLILNKDDDYYTSVFLDAKANFIESNDLKLTVEEINYIVDNMEKFLNNIR